MQIADDVYKLALYAFNDLLFLSNLDSSVLYLMDLIGCFGCLLDYKINWHQRLYQYTIFFLLNNSCNGPFSGTLIPLYNWTCMFHNLSISCQLNLYSIIYLITADITKHRAIQITLWGKLTVKMNIIPEYADVCLHLIHFLQIINGAVVWFSSTESLYRNWNFSAESYSKNPMSLVRTN